MGPDVDIASAILQLDSWLSGSASPNNPYMTGVGDSLSLPLWHRIADQSKIIDCRGGGFGSRELASRSP